jgi:hypothetical protein
MSEQHKKQADAIRDVLMIGRDTLDQLGELPANTGPVVSYLERKKAAIRIFKSEEEALRFVDEKRESGAFFWPSSKGRILAI